MYKNKRTAIIIPAYNEENSIAKVLQGAPDFIDFIVVVDDKSEDGTVLKVKECQRFLGERLVLLENVKNQGCGYSLAQGYKWARAHGIDVAIRMDGDGQMDPADLPNLLDPIIEDVTDYSKGNRFMSGVAYKTMPKLRYFGNAGLSLLTKIVSGYWQIADFQSGYTVINKKALQEIDWDKMYKRYGQPNDLLVRLNVHGFRVKDVSITPVYNVGEKSKMNIGKVFFTISWLLIKLFFWRLKEKYIIRDFHPLVFFYFLGIFLFLVSIGLFVHIVAFKISHGFFPPTSTFAWMFSFSSGLQAMFFGMWFDIEYQKSKII